MENAETDKGVLQGQHKANDEYNDPMVENVMTKVSVQSIIWLSKFVVIQ